MFHEIDLALNGRRLLPRFWISASGFWRRETARIAWSFVALLVSTVLLQLLVQYKLNYWNRDFFNAIERKDERELWAQALRFAPLAAASLTLALISIWGRMTMQRCWREWLSKHLYDYWLLDRRYCKLKFIPGDHQTPEYRIAEDARLATDSPIDLTLGLFSSFLTVITFINILWSVGGSMDIAVFGVAFVVPGYLVLVVVVYSIVTTTATMIISRHLTTVMEDNKRDEANLRAVGAHLRESGESALSSDNQKDGRRAIGAALDQVMARWLALCWQFVRMTLVAHTSFLLTPIVALLLCTPKYVAGTMTLGELVQAAAAFVVVQNAFNWLADNYGRIAEWASSANRVASLLLALDQIDQHESSDEGYMWTNEVSTPLQSHAKLAQSASQFHFER